MRPLEQRRLVQELRLRGHNASQIARLTGISRSTLRGWLAQVKPGSPGEACERCGRPAHDFTRLPEAWYAYLLGMYLGDGVISRAGKGSHVLRITTDTRYPAVIDECGEAMRMIMPSSRVAVQARQGCVEIKSVSKAWPCLIPQHGPGRKHLRRIELAAWQQAIIDREPERFVRGLLHSDGSRAINRVNGNGYARYFFSQVSDDIRRLFCSSLTRLGIEYTWSRWDTVSIARRASVARLDEFVGPKA